MLQEHTSPPATGTPFGWDSLVQAGAAADAKGTNCLCLRFCPTLVLGRGARGWGTPQQGPDLSSERKPRARRGRAGSRLSSEVTVLTCAFSFACSSAGERGSHLSPLPLPLSQSILRVLTAPRRLWLQNLHNSLVTENIY